MKQVFARLGIGLLLGSLLGTATFAPVPAGAKTKTVTTVHGYTRKTKSGKIVAVKSYTRNTNHGKVTTVKGYTRKTKGAKVVTVKSYTRKAANGKTTIKTKQVKSTKKM